MEVTYIGHSGFLVAMTGCQLLFDYQKGTLPTLAADKPLYVLVSHGHGDHYTKKIFHISHPERHYILSDDITDRPRRDDITVLAPWQIYGDRHVRISTLASTDLGVAYLVETEGKVIFHAGDLNCWVWDGETEAKNRQMADMFRTDMEPLRGRTLDAAFMPLDPRQGDDCRLGMDYLLQIAAVRDLFPMHFWDRPQVIAEYRRLTELPAGTTLHDVATPGQHWTL